MTLQGFLVLEFVQVDKRDPLFVSLVLNVYYPKELKQHKGIPFLPPSADQRHFQDLLGATHKSYPAGLPKEWIQYTTADNQPC